MISQPLFDSFTNYTQLLLKTPAAAPALRPATAERTVRPGRRPRCVAFTTGKMVDNMHVNDKQKTVVRVLEQKKQAVLLPVEGVNFVRAAA